MDTFETLGTTGSHQVGSGAWSSGPRRARRSTWCRREERAESRRIEQAKHKSLAFGAEGATGPATTVPWALDRVIGTKFRIVRDYPGDAAEFLAIQRGELERLGSAQWGFLECQPGCIDEYSIVPIYVIGWHRLKEFPEVPTNVDLAPDARDHEATRILATMPAIGITIIAPPAVPQDRVDALRQAVSKITRDPREPRQPQEGELITPAARVERVALLCARERCRITNFAPSRERQLKGESISRRVRRFARR